jgi:peroxiredoxin
VRNKFKDKNLMIIGIHSPEFDRERDVKAVKATAEKHGLSYPHYIDNDFSYWRALKNRYWPAFYLIDKKGRIRLVEVGEMHSGTARAKRLEEQIQGLLAE